MTATNIHIQPIASSPDHQLPRLRRVTNDPAREYAQRPGEVERLPDAIAALILCKKGFSKVGRNGIKVEGITPKPLNFWHEDSVTIQEKAGTNEKVLWVLNRLNPDVIHILKPSGEYVESIPLEGKVPWFDEAATRKVLGAKRRSQNRTIERLRLLHAPESEAAAADAVANDTAMKSAVHTLPAATGGTRAPAHDRSDSSISPRDRTQAQPKGGAERIADASRAGEFAGPARTFEIGQRSNTSGLKNPETVELPSRAEGLARSSARAAFKPADRIHEIQRHLNGRRQSHDDREQTRQSAARFGAASRASDFLSRTPDHASQTAAPVSEDEIW
jgi:hypothetical protein